ncbi:extracellular matrix-binding ebh [Babesia caballi]|uniref:Extracellular matrix-binding ebh n=1 Tax=Babesia caballi TaxID=5871 RepID=A0AAV4M0H0_BABCB|nr:extracellular matrix-binding ebh [Babesia caballi]
MRVHVSLFVFAVNVHCICVFVGRSLLSCWRSSVAMCALRSLVPPFLTILEELQSCNPVWDLPYVPCWNCKLIVTPEYTSYYDKAEWSKVKSNPTEVETCAKIFLGCLPLYYQAITYIYWGCHEKGGGWNAMTLGGGALKSYFDSQGLLPTFVESSRTGAHIAESALQKFSELKTAATSLFPPQSPYASFTTKFREKINGSTSGYTKCPLSALFYGASCYFRYQQITTAKAAGGAPKTISEMLYFLSALQFSSAYDDIDRHIGTLLNPSMNVADSSKPASGGNDTLSAADLKEYLRASCAFSSSVLGMVQGPGATLFSTVSNYAYALQFQLHFLYQQCNNSYTKACGWNQCSYGSNVKIDSVQAHICPTGCTTHGSGDHDHTNGDCKHDNCGTASNKPSPLQAFLTDNLPGFCRKYPGSAHNHLATCSGVLCHVPMGFAGQLRTDAGGGLNIAYALGSFCGGFNTPLRQLSEKLGCLTKRTPRTLGDLFGFTWHLNGQLFRSRDVIVKLDTAIDSRPKTLESLLSKFENVLKGLRPQQPSPPSHFGLSDSVKSIATTLPFWEYLFNHKLSDGLPGKLFDLTQHCHKKKANGSGIGDPIENEPHSSSPIPKHECSTSPADLHSLYQPVGPKPRKSGHTDPYKDCRDQNCGPYLYPLTHTDGATFAPTHASTYLSWVLYLTDDLQSWFQDMLDEFRNIDCSKSGCHGQKCQAEHGPGQHGSSPSCKCPSVVQCGGTLPLLYQHGFRYYSPLELMGGSNDNTKRDCKAFADQLQSVISGNPLTNLLNTIDTFLYAIRWEFFSKLSGFWTIYISLILYTFFFLLDTLHLRSHLKLTSSHTVPPLALLRSGTPLPITKLAYIGQ